MVITSPPRFPEVEAGRRKLNNEEWEQAKAWLRKTLEDDPPSEEQRAQLIAIVSRGRADRDAGPKSPATPPVAPG